MALLRTIIPLVATIMLALLLQLTLSAAVQQDRSGPSCQLQIVEGSAGAGNGSSTHPDLQDFKPPKQSFVDYGDFLLTADLRSVGGVVPSSHARHEPLGLPPDVYHEIFIPPDQTA